MSEAGNAGHAGVTVGEVPVSITGTDGYQWLAGGFFLVHHVDVVIGQQRVQALELTGCDGPATDAFTARADDNLGDVTVMRARVDEQGVWTFTGAGDGVGWQPWMGMTFSRMP